MLPRLARARGRGDSARGPAWPAGRPRAQREPIRTVLAGVVGRPGDAQSPRLDPQAPDHRDPFKDTSEPQQDNWGIGGGVQVNILPRWGITAELMAHSIRFKTGLRADRRETATRPRQLLSNNFVVTEANHWDVPVTLRYYLNGPRQRARPFISGGAAMRMVRNAKSTREIGDIDGGDSEFLNITPEVAADRTMGLVGGLGFELIDDINLKVSVEGRYMRWQEKTFETGLANALRNHVEIMVGVSF